MASKRKIVIIGGSAAGPKAAAKARRLDEHAEITIVQKDDYLSMASCGYPYYVGGFFDDRNMLLCTPTGMVRDATYYFNAKGIVAKTSTEVTRIDRAKKCIITMHLETGKEETISYDALIITTGAKPKKPPIPGIDLEGVTTLQSMRDADYLRKIKDEGTIKEAVIIGGGLIGIETCEALQLAGVHITVVELLPQTLTFLDWELAKLVENHVQSKEAKVITNNGVSEFIGKNGKLNAVKLQDGSEIPCELAVMAIGVTPNSDLAKDADMKIGKTGGIVVNEYMQTSDPNIYAAGDCIESLNYITNSEVHAPYGDLANLQGRVAGENAILGNQTTFPGTQQTGICKVFDFAAGSTGLSEKSAKDAGFEIETVINASPDKPIFMQGLLLVTKLIVDKKSHVILGAQCVGPGDVSKQIAQWALAIKGKLTVEDMVNADLPYAPPFSLAINHGIATAHIMQNKLLGRMDGISALELKHKLDAGEKPFIIDARGKPEYEEMRLGIGENLIPQGELRKRLSELPSDKNSEIICYCKISLRGYESACILRGHGYTNVKVLEGGIMAWPFKREK